MQANVKVTMHTIQPGKPYPHQVATSAIPKAVKGEVPWRLQVVAEGEEPTTARSVQVDRRLVTKRRASANQHQLTLRTAERAAVMAAAKLALAAKLAEGGLVHFLCTEVQVHRIGSAGTTAEVVATIVVAHRV
jgi:hypothetical protein